ncbi:MAG: efflux RND transporter periplasmic adaptor subunit [Thermoanaerobaculia bacterium]
MTSKNLRFRTFQAAALLSSALFIACGGAEGEPSGARSTDRAPAVEAVQAREGALPLSERVSGTVRAENQVAVRAEISAPVVEVFVRSGVQVQRGQPLVRLDESGLRDQLRQAEANVRLAEASAAESRARAGDLETRVARARKLAAEQLLSEQELESLEAQLTAANASARQAAARIDQARAEEGERRSALSRTVIRAPVAGRVGQRNAEVGMIARPDTILFQLGDLASLVVAIPLTQTMLQHVREGDPVMISTPALAAPLRGELKRISPFLDSGSFSTTGEIDVDNADGRLTPGMFVTVDVLYGESDRSTLLPASAIWEDPRTGAAGVFVATSMKAADAPPREPGELADEPGAVEHRAIEVLAEGRGFAGVRGVQPGEWIVVSGQHLIARDQASVARIRPVTWERIVELQGLQRENLLQAFLEKQQQVARARGAKPRTSEEFLTGGTTATQ